MIFNAVGVVRPTVQIYSVIVSMHVIMHAPLHTANACKYKVRTPARLKWDIYIYMFFYNLLCMLLNNNNNNYTYII